MILRLICIGKTSSSYLCTGIQDYVQRLHHYLRFEYIEIPDVKILKGMADSLVKEKEGAALMRYLDPADFVVLLDENGKAYSSVHFADYLQKRFNSGGKALDFVIGGPYGFADELKERANAKISLSPMTFSHQMVRLIAVEQLYRAMTILRNEPYHHE